MAVHSLHVFDRKGKTLYTKQYIKSTTTTTTTTGTNISKDGGDHLHQDGTSDSTAAMTAEQEQKLLAAAEQRKLVFGMLFSLREITASLSPAPTTTTAARGKAPSSSSSASASAGGGLHSVRTGATTLYNYETTSGIRFALFVTNHVAGTSSNSSGKQAAPPPTYSRAIRNALHHIYNELWMNYVVRSPLYRPTNPNVNETNFENKLDNFLMSQAWFR